MPTKYYSPGQLDAMAREQGFPDYVTWTAWNRKRAASLRAPRDYHVQQAAPRNFLQQLLGNIYPPTLLQNVSDAYGRATGEN